MDPLKSLLESAFASAKKGAYKAALDEFKIILSHNPNHAGALFGSAACHYRMSNPAGALEFLERLLKVNPAHPEGLKLLREIRTGGIDPEDGSVSEDPLNPEVVFIDPFGTGLDKQNREVEIIPEWQSPGRDIPGVGEAFREGRISCLAPFHIGKVYLDAWRFCGRNFKKLYMAFWISLIVWVGIWGPFSLWILRSYEEGRLFAFSRVIACMLLYPTTGILSCYCFHLRKDEDLPLSQVFLFANFYPGIVFSLGWLLVPIPLILCFLYGCSVIAGIFLDFSLSSWVLGHLLEIAGVLTLYLWWRCWFLHQSAYSNLDDHPLTVLGRAFYSTRKQQIRLFFFVLFQSLLSVVGFLALGLGIPLVHAAQTEAFLQTQSIVETRDEKIGFVSKRLSGS